MSETAVDAFATAEREDLKANEEAQIAVLQGYLDGLEEISEEEIKVAALEVLDVLRKEGKKIHMGALVKNLVGPRGRFYDKNIDMSSLTRVVRNLIFTGEDEATPKT